MLSRYLRKQYPETECRVLSKFIRGGLAGKLSYIPHMFQQMYHIATSRVVVLDGYCITASVLRHRPQKQVIQMWHALAAIKKFGYQTIGREGGHSQLVADAMCMHRNYTGVLSPGEETGHIYCEAFHVSPEKLIPIGLPRIDRILNPVHSAAEIREAFAIPEDREILLYAPTFRKGEQVPVDQLAAALDPEKFVLVVRLHPLDEWSRTQGEGIDDGKLRVIRGDRFGSYDWMGACDRMVTDYSAMAVEFSLTGKPLYFYVYDIDAYEQSTGLNLDPRRDLPRATAQTPAQLAEILREAYDTEALERFRHKYISVDTENCTAQLGDYIHGIIEEIH